MSRISAASTAGQELGGVVRLLGARVRAAAAARDVPLGRGVEGEPERLRRGQRHRHAVRHHRLVGGVAVGAEVLDPPGDRVGVGVRDVHAGVAEAHPGERRGHRHVAPAAVLVVAVRGRRGGTTPASSASACSDHMSAIGLEPQ